MFSILRRLFVRHQWIELDQTRRTCAVCGRAEARDVDIEVIGSNPWFPIARGNPPLHQEAGR